LSRIIWSDRLFASKIHQALIIVALPGEEAEIFEFDRANLIHYWKQWLSLFNFFWLCNGCVEKRSPI